MIELSAGIRRLTFPLPMAPRHVHCYLLPAGDGDVLVDTGLGLPDLGERWERLLAELEGPITDIVITHFHPDHVGGGEAAAAATGAVVHQGALDYEECVRVWGSAWEPTVADWFVLHGVPDEIAQDVLAQGEAVRPLIHDAPEPERLHAGDRVAGWEIQEFPGHADGHLCLLKDGLMIAGDHLLPDITPSIGLYPQARPDPLGDYLESLRRTIELRPRLALPGHGDPIADPVARAAALVRHHRERLDRTEALLGPEPRTAYELSLGLFGRELPPVQRRFAVAETLSHVERLVVEDRAARSGDDGSLAYTGR